MKRVGSFVLTASCFLLAGFPVACHSSGAAGSGGHPGAGGATGSGGVTDSGGVQGAGGATVSGGQSGFGGTSSSGGSVGSGGQSGAGGMSSSGGASSSGGGSGSGGTLASGGLAGAGGKGGSGGVVASGGSMARGGAPTGGGTTGSGGATGGGGVTGSGGVTGGGGVVASGGSSGGGSTTSGACTDTSTTQFAFTKRYDGGSIAVAGSTKTYWATTNWWHLFGSQTVTINGLSMAIGDPAPGTSSPATDGAPTGFPSIFIGTYSGHSTVGSNLPKQVSAIQSVPTVFSSNASTLDTSNFNATYDVWFTANGTPLASNQSSPGTGGAYLMVWMYKPSDRQPRGGVRGTTGTQANHPGTTVSGVSGTWDVWVDSTNPPCISYVSHDPTDGLTFDLNKFIQDSVTNGYGITNSMYLSIVFGGFEVWSGGDGLQLKQFCATVN